jgi:hypothetical protein
MISAKISGLGVMMLLARMAHAAPDHDQKQSQDQQLTTATTIVTDTDWLGNPTTIPSTFILEPSRKAFQTCIYGCPSVTVSVGPTVSTVITILPLTIPCSLVKCPPCPNTCSTSTISITVCPVITTVTPPPVTATIYTSATPSIAVSKCHELIEKAVGVVLIKGGKEPPVVTITKTRVPIGCPAVISSNNGQQQLPATTTIETLTNSHNTVCSTFVVCQAKRLTCPFNINPSSVSGSHLIDTLQAIMAPSTSSTTTGSEVSSAPATPTTPTTLATATDMDAQKLLQKNAGIRLVCARASVLTASAVFLLLLWL